MAGPNFKNNLRALIAGDVSRTEAIDITDTGVERLVKAYPNLAVLKLQGTRNLRKKAFPAILRNCASIQAVTMTVAKAHVTRKTRLTSFLNWLCDKEFVRGLRYLEFRGVYQSENHQRFLDFLTKVRPALEMVFEWEGRAELIRDMERVPLSRVSKNGTTVNIARENEDDWIDEDDDDSEDNHLISNDAKANGRLLRKLGAQSAMSDALGRDLYDFEMDSDYGDYDFDDSDDEGLDPREMKQMLKLMRQMKG